MSAQDATHSVFTTIDLKACRQLSKGTEGAVWRCGGLPGYPVQLAETDDRSFLSVGPTPEKRRASQQTLRAPNTLFPTTVKRATIEWRVPQSTQATGSKQPSAPYATIVRYFTSRGNKRGQVLVVSKVTTAESCQVTLIDAEANADALALARRIADTTARTFDCSKPPDVRGPADKSPL